MGTTLDIKQSPGGTQAVLGQGWQGREEKRSHQQQNRDFTYEHPHRSEECPQNLYFIQYNRSYYKFSFGEISLYKRVGPDLSLFIDSQKWCLKTEQEGLQHLFLFWNLLKNWTVMKLKADIETTGDDVGCSLVGDDSSDRNLL